MAIYLYNIYTEIDNLYCGNFNIISHINKILAINKRYIFRYISTLV